MKTADIIDMTVLLSCLLIVILLSFAKRRIHHRMHPLLKSLNFQQFSKWDDLQQAVAWYVRFDKLTWPVGIIALILVFCNQADLGGLLIVLIYTLQWHFEYQLLQQLSKHDELKADVNDGKQS